MAGLNREAVKIVLIDTRYVETDAISFKSVVQNLTGKDSCVSWIENQSSFSDNTSGKRKKPEVIKERSFNGGIGVPSVGVDSSIFVKGRSFKDLDRMLMEMPVLNHDLQSWLWDE